MFEIVALILLLAIDYVVLQDTGISVARGMLKIFYYLLRFTAWIIVKVMIFTYRTIDRSICYLLD